MLLLLDVPLFCSMHRNSRIHGRNSTEDRQGFISNPLFSHDRKRHLICNLQTHGIWPCSRRLLPPQGLHTRQLRAPTCERLAVMCHWTLLGIIITLGLMVSYPHESSPQLAHVQARRSGNTTLSAINEKFWISAFSYVGDYAEDRQACLQDQVGTRNAGSVGILYVSIQQDFTSCQWILATSSHRFHK